MRYSTTEDTVVVGTLFPGKTVKIKVIDLASDRLLSISSDVCIESNHLPGVYMWNTTNIDIGELTQSTTLLCEMTSIEDDRKHYSKLVFGGYPNEVASIPTILDNLVELTETTDLISARV